MKSRAVAMYLGSIVCIAWAVLTAIAYLRRDRPVPATYREPDDGVQPWDARSVTLASGGETRVYWH